MVVSVYMLDMLRFTLFYCVKCDKQAGQHQEEEEVVVAPRHVHYSQIETVNGLTSLLC